MTGVVVDVEIYSPQADNSDFWEDTRWGLSIGTMYTTSHEFHRKHGFQYERHFKTLDGALQGLIDWARYRGWDKFEEAFEYFEALDINPDQRNKSYGFKVTL